MKKQLTVSGLRNIIRSVISEHQSEFNSYDAPDEEDWVQEYPEDNGRDPGPEAEVLTADDVADKVDDGYAALDELAASAGYDDIAGDIKAIDQKFSFEVESDGTILATDNDIGSAYWYNIHDGLWEHLGEAILKRPIIRETTLKDTPRNLTFIVATFGHELGSYKTRSEAEAKIASEIARGVARLKKKGFKMPRDKAEKQVQTNMGFKIYVRSAGAQHPLEWMTET